MKKRMLSLLLAAVMLISFLPQMGTRAQAHKIVMTAQEFIDCLWVAYNRPNYYYNKFPYNLGYYDGSRISFDCWNLGKAIIWSKGTIVNNYTKGHYAPVDTSCGLGDWDGLTIVKAAPNCSSDFTNLVPGEWLYMDNHTGYYIGDGKVIECTAGWDVWGITISQIDSSGRRSRNGVYIGSWKLHGMVPWLDYSTVLEPEEPEVTEEPEKPEEPEVTEEPEKPEEIPLTFDGVDPLYMGKDFNAYIRNTATGKYVSDVNDDLEVRHGVFNATQIFHFIYNEDDGTYSIRNDAKNKYIDVTGAVYENGTELRLSQGNGQDNQRFYLYYTRGNFYIRCKSAEKVFDAALATGNMALYGSTPGEYDESRAARAFEILKMNLDYGDRYLNLGTEDVVYVRNVASGLLMSTDGSNVFFEGAGYTEKQRWKMIRRPDGSYEFVSLATGKCLDVANGNITKGTSVGLWDRNGHRAQGFYVLPSDTDGYYVIKPCYAEYVLDMGADSRALALYPSHLEWDVPRAAQLFEIVFEKAENNTRPAVNIGEEFNAYIIDKAYGQAFTDLGNGVLESRESTNAANQLFRFIYDAATNSYEIVGSSGKALDVIMTEYKNESIVGLFDRNNWVAQRFRLYEVNGYYAISPIHTNRLVDVHGLNFTTVQLYGTQVKDNRLFTIAIKEDPPMVTGKSFTLSFEDEVLVNFYYEISDTTDVVEQGMLVFYDDDSFTVENADEKHVGSAFVPSKGCYMNTAEGIAAKEMGDTRYYTAYAKLADGTYIYSDIYDYSPKKYALNMLGKETTTDKQKALCVAMLNYGAAAQAYFGYNVENLMNSQLTNEQKALVMEYDRSLFSGAVAAPADKVGVFVSTNSGFTSRFASVSFDGAFSVNYYMVPSEEVDGTLQLYIWTPDSYANAQKLTAQNASATVAMIKQDDGSYWNHVTGIAAKRLDETYYVASVYTDVFGNTHCTGVIAYSLSRYCINNANGKMGELARATAMYGYYAKQYFS